MYEIERTREFPQMLEKNIQVELLRDRRGRKKDSINPNREKSGESIEEEEKQTKNQTRVVKEGIKITNDGKIGKKNVIKK